MGERGTDALPVIAQLGKLESFDGWASETGAIVPINPRVTVMPK
jgi:hypothetical protein